LRRKEVAPAVAAFADLDWRRIDVRAIVSFGGIATIDEPRSAACRAWLQRHEYRIETLDCRPGLDAAIPVLGRLFRWEEQFGYALTGSTRNLDALRDGFEFEIPENGGCVFELLGADRAFEEDSGWLLGLLAIAQEHSRAQLALGRRFFALLVIVENSPLIGAVIDKATVPVPFWDRPRAAR
jgi:hypothetical protein